MRGLRLLKSRKRLVGCLIAADKKGESVRRNETRFKGEPAEGDTSVSYGRIQLQKR